MNSATIDTADLDSKIADLSEALERQHGTVSDLEGKVGDARAAHDAALQAVDLDAAARHSEDASDLEGELAQAQAVVASYRGALDGLTAQRQAAGYAAQRDALTGQIDDARSQAAVLLEEVQASLAALPAKLAQARGIEQHRVNLEAERHTLRQALGDVADGFNFMSAATTMTVAAAVDANPLLAAVERMDA